MIDHAEIPLREVLEGALRYMQESETAARRSCGYPKDLERCLEYQIAAHAKESNPKADVAPASGAHVQRVVGCEPLNGEKP